MQTSIQTPDAWYDVDYLGVFVATLPDVANVHCYPPLPLNLLDEKLSQMKEHPVPFALLLLNVAYNDPGEKSVLNHWIVLLIDKPRHHIYTLDPAQSTVAAIANQVATAWGWENFTVIKNPIDFQLAERHDVQGLRDCGVYAFEIKRCLLNALRNHQLPTTLTSGAEIEDSLLAILTSIPYGEEANTALLRTRHINVAYAYLQQQVEKITAFGECITAHQTTYHAPSKSIAEYLWANALDRKTQKILACVNQSAYRFFKEIPNVAITVISPEEPTKSMQVEKQFS